MLVASSSCENSTVHASQRSRHIRKHCAREAEEIDRRERKSLCFRRSLETWGLFAASLDRFSNFSVVHDASPQDDEVRVALAARLYPNNQLPIRRQGQHASISEASIGMRRKRRVKSRFALLPKARHDHRWRSWLLRDGMLKSSHNNGGFEA